MGAKGKVITPNTVVGRKRSQVKEFGFSPPVDRYTNLGRGIKISPKANASISKPGKSITFGDATVEVLIGIGNDHHARLIMDEEAWKALVDGDDIHIKTNKEFRKEILGSSR